jgi:CubicO group peptidase (beta-lactamase class C family)
MTKGNWITFRKVNTGIPAYLPYTDIDAHVATYMGNTGADKAVICFGFDDKLLAFRAYGTTVDRRFRMASLAKHLTGSAIAKIIADGTGGVTASTLVAAYLGYNSPADSRASSITVDHLIKHKGGWDNGVSPDHVFNNRAIATTMGVTSPPTDAQLVQYAVNIQTLDFAPGTQTHYANIGYVTLGEVIRVASGKSYVQYVNDMLAARKISMLRGYALVQDGTEVPYLDGGGNTNSVYGTAPGASVPWPYGGFGIENMTAGGGWVSRIADMGLFYAGTIPGGPWPAPAGDDFPTTSGWSWGRTEAGSMPGTYAPTSRRWNMGGAEGTDHLRFATGFFNRRTGTPATDDAIAANLDADLQLMV